MSDELEGYRLRAESAERDLRRAKWRRNVVYAVTALPGLAAFASALILWPDHPVWAVVLFVTLAAYDVWAWRDAHWYWPDSIARWRARALKQITVYRLAEIRIEMENRRSESP